MCYVIGSKIQCQTVLNALVERSAAIPASLVAYQRCLWRQRGVSSAASMRHTGVDVTGDCGVGSSSCERLGCVQVLYDERRRLEQAGAYP